GCPDPGDDLPPPDPPAHLPGAPRRVSGRSRPRSERGSAAARDASTADPSQSTGGRAPITRPAPSGGGAARRARRVARGPESVDGRPRADHPLGLERVELRVGDTEEAAEDLGGVLAGGR